MINIRLFFQNTFTIFYSKMLLCKWSFLPLRIFAQPLLQRRKSVKKRHAHFVREKISSLSEIQYVKMNTLENCPLISILRLTVKSDVKNCSANAIWVEVGFLPTSYEAERYQVSIFVFSSPSSQLMTDSGAENWRLTHPSVQSFKNQQHSSKCYNL